ncbi:ser/Thr protein phosphatase family [Xylaria bambusicola]|uniref:ser/Thr protein phosphatase family n=1 Tax=Xylaria bambusicola TaxID=326684 RepID=UPI0020079E54|nr:ser/Thr protein phosphatase family [Xylaria bambusicola]KAI0509190.1 ser/Thr protein phosphatase family [Xylaria bambusicola]
MTYKTAAVLAALAAVANAAQPEAPTPVAVPMRELDWGQINFLHTTDIHGWLGGHLQEPQYSADWGDYISFTEHMHRKADEQGVDLLVVDTGDRIEGNGLYDSSTPKGNYTYDIYGQQSVDILCTGNHELYHEDSIAREHNITVPHFKKNYVASNLDYIEPETGNRIPQAQRYIKFKTKNQGLNVVAFGFIFNFDRNANNSVIQRVEDAIKEKWFQDAIREKPDLFVVLGHVGLRMQEFEQIFKVIRDANWYTPIAFLGGHAHVRDARKFDSQAVAIASGRYFETIGWMSISGIQKQTKDVVSTKATATFKRRYIDNNVLGLQHHAGVDNNTFATPQGRNVTGMIANARKALHLDQKLGCSPRDLWMTRAKYPSDTSIYSWLETDVVPDSVVNKGRADKPRLTIVNTGAIRFDIFKGPFTKDSTYLISPFTSKFSYIADVPYAVAKKVIQLLNNGGVVFEAGLNPKYMSIPEQMAPSPFLGKEPASPLPARSKFIDGQQQPLVEQEPELIGGYTTKDDLGDDGDDAVHSPIKFYSVPNCIQSQAGFSAPPAAEPEAVDLVFIDYVQPWIIPALEFSGGDYSSDNITMYMNSTLTEVIAGWVQEHWKEGC